MFSKKIYLYWWKHEVKENYGDALAPYIVKKISGKEIVQVLHPRGGRWYKYFKKHYVTVGSIIGLVSARFVVWGSGIMKANQNVAKATFLAVRGPRSRSRLLELGYKCPAVYGDPALLLPLLIPNNVPKKYKLGIVPHYTDYDLVNKKFSTIPNIKIIDLLTNDVEQTTRDILECEQIISSSLHGVIVSHAYQIPALWVRFYNKLAGDNVKFYDYFESVSVLYNKEFIFDVEKGNLNTFFNLLEENRNILLPEIEKVKALQDGLLRVCPFKK